MPPCSARLAVVDDEPDMRSMLAEYFAAQGYEVLRCADGAELDRAQESASADLILLDVTLPGEDGISIAQRLRAQGRTPIIMLTARDEIVDRVVGLEAGADDYLTKPFDLYELRARVRALLRRADPQVDADCMTGGLVSFGTVFLDLDGRVLVDGEGRQTDLTVMEFDMLATFARNPNKVLSRERLLRATRCCTAEYFDRAIDIRIARIRKKIEIDPAKPQVIRTVRNAGYIFVPPSTPRP